MSLPAVPELARELRDLFTQDQEHAIELNHASDRHRAALEQLTRGLPPESIREIYGQAALDAMLSGRKPEVLEADQPVTALGRVATELHTAWTAHQRVAEDRRVLGVNVGERLAELEHVMTTAGFAPGHGGRADLDELAQGRFVIT